MSEVIDEDVKVVQTNSGKNDGQNKCPQCGATDISLNSKTGKLRCNFCRHEFEPEISKTELDYDDITQLKGEIIGSGAKNINSEASSIITLKCESCGAEVVIDTNETTQARCHWCRNTLSINNQVPNGAVPDVVLPFSLSRDEAKSQIEGFVKKRRFFAHPRFKKEFCVENVMGVYLPYMIIDVNSHVRLIGKGERETRRYTEKHGDRTETYYDADLYEVGREFDMTIDDLTVESSSDKLKKRSSSKTNNIINSIMPFDTKNCVEWDANYLKGFSSEKRDTNVEDLRQIVDTQVKDIARIGINSDLSRYDRGVRWENEQLEIKGRSWKTAYLPVWLYSYQQKKGNSSLLHYVAVNARTKETMGSIPVHMPKLILASIIVEIFSWCGKVFIDQMMETDYSWIILICGFVFFWLMYAYYRNTGARHTYELETRKEIFNIMREDRFLRRRDRLSESRMSGANNTKIYG